MGPSAGNNTGASRLTTGASRPNNELAEGRKETCLRRAITQALRARTKSSPTASKTFGLRPNGDPPTAGNNTGASRPNKELAYGEQNIQPSAEWNPAFGGPRRAITQALRARTKSSPTASKTFGLRPN